MTPYPKDIKIRFGDVKEIFFRVRERQWDAATSKWVPGDYRDLTGYTVLSQVRATSEDTTVLLSFTATLGNQSDVENGRGSVFLKVTSAQTAAVARTVTTAVWDCQLTDSGGNTNTYVGGAVTFEKDVSRAV